MDKKYEAIGVLDSGLGGLSVLREAINLMPNENYIYFGDSKNAPYGIREVEDVKKLTYKAVDFCRLSSTEHKHNILLIWIQMEFMLNDCCKTIYSSA